MAPPQNSEEIMDVLALGMVPLVVFSFGFPDYGLLLALVSWLLGASYFWREVDLSTQELGVFGRRVGLLFAMVGLHIILFGWTADLKNAGLTVMAGSLVLFFLSQQPAAEVFWKKRIMDLEVV